MEAANYYAKISKENKPPDEALLAKLDSKIKGAALSGMTSLTLHEWEVYEIDGNITQQERQSRTDELALYCLIFDNQEFFINLGFDIKVTYNEDFVFSPDYGLTISWS